MPHEYITLNVLNYTPGHSGDAVEIESVAVNQTIEEVKVIVAEKLQSLPAGSILLYLGTLQMDDDRTLREYNKSNRARVSIYAYEKKEIVVNVKTLQHIGAGGCVCVPLWAFIMRNTIKIRIYDHETVGELRKRIAGEIGDPDMYSPEKLKLTLKRELMQDDAVMLKDANICDGTTLTLLVHCCFSLPRTVLADRNVSSQREEIREEEKKNEEEIESEPAKDEICAGKDELNNM